MTPLNKQQKYILNYLIKKGGFVSPTEIGLSAGKSNASACSWGSNHCQRLLGKKLVERSKEGWYKAVEGKGKQLLLI